MIGYEVWSWDESEGWFQIGTFPPNATSAIDKGMIAGITYYYCVTAFNTAGHSDCAWTAVFVPVVNPTAPSNLRVEPAGPSALRVTWQVGRSNGGYEVWRWDQIAGWKFLGLFAPDITSYVDRDVVTKQAYWYYLAAFNGRTYSTWAYASGAP